LCFVCVLVFFADRIHRCNQASSPRRPWLSFARVQRACHKSPASDSSLCSRSAAACWGSTASPLTAGRHFKPPPSSTASVRPFPLGTHTYTTQLLKR
jgi:hypothetical protein